VISGTNNYCVHNINILLRYPKKIISDSHTLKDNGIQWNNLVLNIKKTFKKRYMRMYRYTRHMYHVHKLYMYKSIYILYIYSASFSMYICIILSCRNTLPEYRNELMLRHRSCWLSFFFRDLFRKHKIKCLPFINLINSTHRPAVRKLLDSHLINHLILSLYTEYKKTFKVILIVNSPIVKTNCSRKNSLTKSHA